MLLCVCAFLIAPSLSLAEAPRDIDDFCGPRLAHDYLEPLSQMEPIRGVPSSGELSFGPKGLTLKKRGGRLVVGSGWVGFGFSDEAVGHMRRLGWDVSVRLFKVNSRGRPVARLGSKRRRIGFVDGNKIKDFLFRVSGEAAYYRVDISFQRIGSDRTLGVFSNYVRVVRPEFDSRLLLQQESTRGGSVLPVRLANYGTEPISSMAYDWQFKVQYFNGQEWVIAPSDPPVERHKLLIRKLGPGMMDKCIYFRVPSDETPGLYRFSMVVRRNRHSGLDRHVQLTTEFTVHPGSRQIPEWR
jgi:hypothetical protein